MLKPEVGDMLRCPPTRLRPLAEYSFALGIALLPFAKVGSMSVRGVAVQIADVIVAITAVVWLIALLRGEIRLRLGAAHLALAGYVAAALLSLTATPSLSMSLVKLFGLGYLITLFVLAHTLATTERTLRLVVGSYLLGLTVTAVVGCLAVVLFYLGVHDRAWNPFLGRYGSIPVGGWPRVQVFFNNPNMALSYYIVGLAGVAMAWVLFPGRRRLLLALAAVTATAALFTLSAGLGGVTLGGTVGFLLLRRRRGLPVGAADVVVTIAGTVVAVAFAALCLVNLVPRGQGDVRLGPVDLQLQGSGRIALWRAAIRTYTEHPIVGAGLGVRVSETAHPRAMTSMEKWGTEEMKHPPLMRLEAHHVWLNILGQMGFPGVIGFAAFLFFVGRGLVPVSRRGTELDLLGIAVLSALVGAVLYHGLFAALEEARHVWFLFGLALSVKGLSATEGEQGADAQA